MAVQREVPPRPGRKSERAAREKIETFLGRVITLPGGWEGHYRLGNSRRRPYEISGTSSVISVLLF